MKINFTRQTACIFMCFCLRMCMYYRSFLKLIRAWFSDLFLKCVYKCRAQTNYWIIGLIFVSTVFEYWNQSVIIHTSSLLRGLWLTVSTKPLWDKGKTGDSIIQPLIGKDVPMLWQLLQVLDFMLTCGLLKIFVLCYKYFVSWHMAFTFSYSNRTYTITLIK